jgi:hypothetical protein
MFIKRILALGILLVPRLTFALHGYGGHPTFKSEFLRALPLIIGAIFAYIIWKLILKKKSPNKPTVGVRKIRKTLLLISGIVIGLGIFGIINIINSTFSIDSAGSIGRGPIPDVTGNHFFENNKPNSIADTREFLKTYYSGKIATRDVQSVIQDVSDVIDQVNGRIDNRQSEIGTGAIKFVVPKSSFSSFEGRIASLGIPELYTISTRSENRLSDKKSLEIKKEETLDNLVEFGATKNELEKSYQTRLFGLNKKIKQINSEIRDNENARDISEDFELRSIFQNRIYTISEELVFTQRELNLLNLNYKESLENINSSIDGTYNRLEDGIEREKEFFDDIETVEGTITVQWVTYWEVYEKRLPIHPTYISTILFLLLCGLLKRIKNK